MSFLSIVLIMFLAAFTPIYAASVPPQTIPGNDSNPNPPNNDPPEEEECNHCRKKRNR